MTKAANFNFVKRHLLIVFLYLMCIAPSYAQDANWDFFVNIPNTKQIVLSSDGKTFTINPDYTVSFHYEKTNDQWFYMGKVRAQFSYLTNVDGQGTLQWSNGGMVLDIVGEISVSSDGWKGRKSYSIEKGFLITRYEKVWVDCVIEDLDRKKQFTNKYKFSVANGSAKLESLSGPDPLSFQFEWDYSWKSGYDRDYSYDRMTASVYVLGTYNMNIQESEADTNMSIGDQYGNWFWNEDRSILSLNSVSKKEKLNIINDGSNVFGLEITTEHENPVGINEAAMQGVGNVASLAMSLDNQPDASIIFKRDGNTFTYGQYDRFSNQFNKNANSLLEQMKVANFVIITYKIGDHNVSAVFKSTGLEALYNALIQFNSEQRTKTPDEQPSDESNVDDTIDDSSFEIEVDEAATIE